MDNKHQVVVEMKFGSHLYGTATKDSDLDIKGIYLPSAKDILLQRIKPVYSKSRLKKQGEKNSFADIDYELYSPGKFLSLLAEGQMIPLEMLFAPKEVILSEPHPLWEDIKSLAPHIFSKRTNAFIQYCKRQANKYGIKGSRVSAARIALERFIEIEIQYGSTAKLMVAEDRIKDLLGHSEFFAVNETVNSKGEVTRFFDICGKKANFNASIKSARQLAQKLMDEYGERALAAEKNQGIDWKALSHAVRVGHQAIEFLTKNHITFPRPEATHLLDIKLGRLSYEKVASEIEVLLLHIEKVSNLSKFPANIDSKLIDNFLEKTYAFQVLRSVKEC